MAVNLTTSDTSLDLNTSGSFIFQKNGSNLATIDSSGLNRTEFTKKSFSTSDNLQSGDPVIINSDGTVSKALKSHFSNTSNSIDTPDEQRILITSPTTFIVIGKGYLYDGDPYWGGSNANSFTYCIAMVPGTISGDVMTITGGSFNTSNPSFTILASPGTLGLDSFNSDLNNLGLFLFQQWKVRYNYTTNEVHLIYDYQYSDLNYNTVRCIGYLNCNPTSLPTPLSSASLTLINSDEIKSNLGFESVNEVIVKDLYISPGINEAALFYGYRGDISGSTQDRSHIDLRRLSTSTNINISPDQYDNTYSLMQNANDRIFFSRNGSLNRFIAVTSNSNGIYHITRDNSNSNTPTRVTAYPADLITSFTNMSFLDVSSVNATDNVLMFISSTSGDNKLLGYKCQLTDSALTYSAQSVITTNSSGLKNSSIYLSSTDEILIQHVDWVNSFKPKLLIIDYSAESITNVTSDLFIDDQSTATFNALGTRLQELQQISSTLILVYIINSTGNNIENRIANVIPVTNITSTNFLGFYNATQSSYNFAGTINNEQSSLTPGSLYYIKDDATLTTVSGDGIATAGIALSATEILIGN